MSFQISREGARRGRIAVASCSSLVFVALFASSLATAGEPKSDREKAPADAASSQESAMRVYIDPETGRRTSRPSDAARRGLDEANAHRPEFSQSSEGLVERPAPGGGVIVDLEGRFQSSTRVKLGADGTRELYCTDPLHSGTDHVHANAEAASPAREER